MVLVFPSGFLAREEPEQAVTAHCVAGGFHEKGAAPPRTDQRVDLKEQVFGQKDVSAAGHCVRI